MMSVRKIIVYYRRKEGKSAALMVLFDYRPTVLSRRSIYISDSVSSSLHISIDVRH